MKFIATFFLLALSLVTNAQSQIDEDWILVGKSHKEFKQFTKNADLKRPNLIGGKTQEDTLFRYTFTDNTFEKIVVDNRYEYTERAVTWFFTNETITAQVHNRLTEGILDELTRLYGQSSTNSTTTLNSFPFEVYEWNRPQYTLKLYSYKVHHYLTISSNANNSNSQRALEMVQGLIDSQSN